MRARRLWTVIAATAAVACASLAAPVTTSLALPYPIDTITTSLVAHGVTHGYIYIRSGPWAIHVLAIDLDRCNAAVSVKGAAGAIGRTKTSALLANLAKTRDVIGGVNADFFSLKTPQGVPDNALVSGGRVVSGPSAQPVLAFDATGKPHITTVHVSGHAIIGKRTLPIDAWNHPAPSGLSLYDTNWSHATDTASSVVEVLLSAGPDQRVVLVDTANASVAIPSGGSVLIAGAGAPDDVRAALLALRPGDIVRTSVALVPNHLREVVGGGPLLVHDSLIAEISDGEHQPGFATNRHPRTAAGIARNGKRLLLVAVDGRQAPYSDGMTLDELARFLLALGAREALNLDGGGSTTLVYADSLHALRIANTPSDSAGERPVGDALAIVNRCAKR